MHQRKVIRTLLIDDQRHVHEAVTTILNNLDDIELVGHGTRGDEALSLCVACKPDVVLMDVMMPVMDGIEATRQLITTYPDLKILVLSSFQDDESVQAMLQNGASGYVLKGALLSDLANAIRTVFGGNMVLASEVMNVVLNTKPEAKAPQQNFNLTQRELEVLRLMARGLNNNDIADELVISRSTVKFHVANIIRKMEVETRTEAMVLAAKNKLV